MVAFIVVSTCAATTQARPQLWDAYSRSVGSPIERPKAERALCSFDEPICIHVAPGTPKSAVFSALTVAVRSLQLYRGLGLPAPMSDANRGGSAAFDVYLAPEARSRAYADSIPATVGFDRAAAFATVWPNRPGPPCTFDSDVARVMAQGMLLAVDGGIAEGVLAAHSSWLADIAAPCPALTLDAIDRAQQRPDHAIAFSSADNMAGEMLFPWFLDDVYGTGSHGAVMTALIGVSSQLTPAGNEYYVNEPDVFDALRAVALAREMNFGEILIEYAIARAFIGDRSDAAHLRGVEWFDTLGRVRFEWAVTWSDLPKRVAPAYALEPTGSGYVWLDLTGRPAHAEALIVIDWEATHVFQWAVVRIDAEGRELGRHLIGGTFGETQAQLSLRDLDGSAALLIVGIHLGNDDRSQPYDPEAGAPREASYTVTMHAQ